MTEVEITVLGAFAVVVHGRAIPSTAWPSRRAAELVQFLSIADGHQVLRDQAIEALWPHLDADAGAANLRKASHHARQALGRPGAVVLRQGSVVLFPDGIVEVDAADFERAATAALAAGEPAACASAADAYQGDLLPGGVYEEWTQEPRQRLAALHIECLRQAGRWKEVVAADPLDEAAHRELMSAALATGSRAAALRWYGRLRHALATELGVAPDIETERLYAECVAGTGVLAPDLVGRDHELAVLDALVASRGPDHPVGIVLRGRAGVGKTALARAFAARAREAGCAVVSIEASDGRTPYGALADAVESLLTNEVAATLADHTRAVLAALAPRTGPVPPTDGPLSRHQVIGALRRLLLAGTDGRPIVVIADDLHAVDDATVEALLHLVSPRDPIVLVLPLRGEAARPELDRQLGRLVRAHRLAVVEVGPLDADAAAALARAVADRTLEDSTLAEVVALAEGNPFTIIELARRAATRGDHVPADIGKVITDRLVDLPEAEVVALRRLALLDGHVDVAGVVALTSGDEASAFALLDRALDAGVLIVVGDQYRFRHDIVRRALADQVPPHERFAAHREAARRLASANGPPAEVARHWLAGARPLEAVGPLLAVARQAQVLGAFTAALDALADVLAALPTHAIALRLRAEALDALGDVGTVPAYDTAIEQADDADRHDLRAKRALAQLKQGDATGAVRALDGVHPTAVDARLAEALTYSGAAALGFIPPDVGTARSAECRRLALEAGDAGAIVVASWAGAAAAHARGELRDSVLADLRDTHHLPHLATRVFDGQLCVTQRLLYGARPYDDVIAFADALAAEARRLGAARGHAFGTILRGEAELLAGRLDDAERDLIEARYLHRDIGGATGEAHALQRLAEVALCRGDIVDASALLDEALDLARATDMGFHLFDRIYGTRLTLAVATGDSLAALGEAEASVRGVLETCPGCRITFAVPAAIAAAHAGDLHRAADYEQAVAFLASVVMRLPAWNAAHHEVRALLHRAEGDDTAASAEMIAAADAFAAAGQPLDELRCRASAR